MLNDLPFAEVWAGDFEYEGEAGNRPTPVCLVARELHSGRELRLWQDELETRPAAPFPVGDNALFVAYYASAEIGCFLALGWPVPTRILDLFTEFRACTNGLPTTSGASLLGALVHFGLDAMGTTEKEDMRNLILGAVRGQAPNAPPSSITARRTWMPWRACCRPCCLTS